MYKIGENEMVSCPYNRSHLVSKLRIQKHIIKCQDRYPEVKLITCFYNYTHKLKPEDILKHYEICSQKIRMEEARYCENNGYDSCKSEVYVKSFCDSINNEKASLFSTGKTNSVKSYGAKDSRLKTPQNESRNVNGKDDDDDDDDDEEEVGDYLRPLNLPKTLSKAFTRVKSLTDKSSESVPASEPVSFPSRGLSRGKTFFFNPPKLRTNHHFKQDGNDMKNGCPKIIRSRSKYFSKSASNIENSCSTSMISAAFDDGNTLKSDDITFYDDENEDNDDDDDDDDDGFIFKNFDKYIRF